MFAPQNQQPNVIDSMSGSMEEWYNAVDEAVKKSDVIPGNYEYTVATSYGNVGKIVEDSSTYFDITCDRFKVISLDNSYITIEQDLEIGVSTQANISFQTYYIGYKYAADVIDQYRIYSNSDLIQTQNHARYEWYMMYNSVSDEAKENSDLYATLHKIRTMNPNVPGIYVNLANIAANRKIKIHLKNRIPLSSFLTLFNLRFYPNWSGKMSIEVYPSYKNLVIAPVIPETNFDTKDFVDLYNQDSTACNVGFVNINQAGVNNGIQTQALNTTWLSHAQVFTCDGTNCCADKCKIRLATYLLKMDIFNSLAAKYIQVPLIFPIQTVQIKDFTSQLQTGANVDISTANTLALKHCDAMFVVFKRDVYDRTCFINPQIEYQFNVDGKFYPREICNTVDDERSLNLTLDALNINNSLLTSVSKDLRTSLQPYTVRYGYAAGGGDPNASPKLYSGGDQSNFMIGIPFADSEDFMGGISTTGTVQIELRGKRLDVANIHDIPFHATAICFEDALLKIRAVKPDGRSQIEITHASIEQILAGGAI